MGNINIGRWILGGVVAGIVMFVVDFVLNGMVLMQQWADAMAALQIPVTGESPGGIAIFVVLNLLVGLAAVWIYAGIRPRFGPGAKTAVYAGLAVWVLSCLVPFGFFLAVGLFPASLMWTVIVVGLVQAPVATVAGAYFYQED